MLTNYMVDKDYQKRFFIGDHLIAGGAVFAGLI